MELIERLAQRSARPLTAITGQVTNAVAGTRSSHAHGLRVRGVAVTPDFAIAVPTADDADGALGEGTIRVVRMDATNVVVRATGTAVSVPFTLLVA